jgi:tyrosine-protein kinase
VVPGVPLRHYASVVRRRKWIILQALVIVPCLAVAYSLHQQRLYQANAKVLLSTQSLSNTLTGTQSLGVQVQAGYLAQTQAQVAEVSAVARHTLKALHLDRSVQYFKSHSAVSANPNAEILTFSVVDHHAPLAAREATEYATQYILYARKLATASLQQARRGVDKQLAQLVKQKKTVGTLYLDLSNRDQQLATMEALQGAPASLIQAAGKTVQVQPKTARNAVLGVLLGIVFGLGLAFLREALDTRVRTAQEISERLGLPLLARLPEPGRRLQRDEQLAMVADPRGVAAEAYRMLRTNLEFVRLDHDVRTIMITSAVTQEGKSTTAANLAVALARAGQQVALVDLDLRRPFIHRFFDLAQPGLTHVAIGQATLEDALRRVPVSDSDTAALASSNGHSASTNGHTPVETNGHGPGPWEALLSARGGSLDVLTSGPLPPNVGEFVGSEKLAEILRDLRSRFETVIIDTPPTLQVGDASAMSSMVDAVVVIARMNIVRRAMLRELRRQLDAWPAHKLGFVVADAQEEEEGYGYGYAYGYGYGYGYAERPAEGERRAKEEEIPQR